MIFFFFFFFFFFFLFLIVVISCCPFHCPWPPPPPRASSKDLPRAFRRALLSLAAPGTEATHLGPLGRGWVGCQSHGGRPKEAKGKGGRGIGGSDYLEGLVITMLRMFFLVSCRPFTWRVLRGFLGFFLGWDLTWCTCHTSQIRWPFRLEAFN